MPTSARLVSAVLLLAYLAALAGVLMQYDAAVAITVVTGTEDWLASIGAPAAMTASGRVQFVLNAAMIVPPVCLASLLLPRHPWANWVVYGFLASCAVELVQGLYLPPRSAEFADVVANTLGALGGALLARLLIRLLERRAPSIYGSGTR